MPQFPEQKNFIQKYRPLAIIVASVLVIIIIIVTIVGVVSRQAAEHANTVAIAGLDTCAPGLPHDSELKIQKTYYDFIAAQLRADERSWSESQYEAVLRTGTCNLSEFRDSADHSGYTAKFIIDVEQLGYSFGVAFSYVRAGDPALKDVDLGAPQLYCLPESDLLYGKFNCAGNSLIQSTSGPAVETDITKLLPYTDPAGRYHLQLVASSETKSGYTIVITYTPGTNFYLTGDTAEYRTTYRQKIEDYLTSHGQDLSLYDFFEKWK